MYICTHTRTRTRKERWKEGAREQLQRDQKGISYDYHPDGHGDDGVCNHYKSHPSWICLFVNRHQTNGLARSEVRI